jgi:hypothetical protein
MPAIHTIFPATDRGFFTAPQKRLWNDVGKVFRSPERTTIPFPFSLAGKVLAPWFGFSIDRAIYMRTCKSPFAGFTSEGS